jgi:hypothetical protein
LSFLYLYLNCYLRSNYQEGEGWSPICENTCNTGIFHHISLRRWDFFLHKVYSNAVFGLVYTINDNCRIYHTLYHINIRLCSDNSIFIINVIKLCLQIINVLIIYCWPVICCESVIVLYWRWGRSTSYIKLYFNFFYFKMMSIWSFFHKNC